MQTATPILTASCVLVTLLCGIPASADPAIPEESLTLEQLVSLSDKELADVDIAAMNLACALGLPGSEDMDRKALLDRLDAWTRHVGSETRRHHYRFEQHPEDYNHSFGEFAMLLLTNTMQEDLGVRYHPEQAKALDDPSKFDFTRSQDLFIHGLLDGTGGTCPSMPVLYIAVGRRLGYPLKLVTTAEHSFLRWDDPDTGERFNIEGTSRGYGSFTDDHYESFPRVWNTLERETGGYLESLSPREELAVFLCTRADCLFFSGRLADAYHCYKTAAKLSPRNYPARYQLRQTERLLATARNRDSAEAAYQRHEQRRRTDPRLFIPGLPTVESLSATYRQQAHGAPAAWPSSASPSGWGTPRPGGFNNPYLAARQTPMQRQADESFARMKRGSAARSRDRWQHTPPWRSAAMGQPVPGVTNHAFPGYSAEDMAHLADAGRPDSPATYPLDPADLRTMSEKAVALQRELIDRSDPWYFVDASRKHRIGIHGPSPQAGWSIASAVGDSNPAARAATPSATRDRRPLTTTRRNLSTPVQSMVQDSSPGAHP